MLREPRLRSLFAILTLCLFAGISFFSPVASALEKKNCNKIAAEVGGDIMGGLAGAADALVSQNYGNSVCVNPYTGYRYACYNPHVQVQRSGYLHQEVSSGVAELICSMTEKDEEEWENARNEALDGKSDVEFDASYDPNSKVVGSVSTVRSWRQSGRLCRLVRTHLYKRSDKSESGQIDETYCVNEQNTWKLVETAQE